MGKWKGQGPGGGCSQRSMSVQCLEGLRELPSGCVLNSTAVEVIPKEISELWQLDNRTAEHGTFTNYSLFEY